MQDRPAVFCNYALTSLLAPSVALPGLITAPATRALPARRLADEGRTQRSGTASGDCSPAVFIDKDGTLVEDVPYNVDPARLRFTRGALPGLRLLTDAGLPIVIVSNQPGLSTGRFTRAEFAGLQAALGERLRAEAGVELAGFYVCPHAPATSLGASCLCRKPEPGLLRQAAIAHRYDLSRSWMIGDILDDVEAGRRAGCRTILLDVGNETEWRLSPLRTPHQRCHDLLTAARIIVLAHAADENGRPNRPVDPESP